MQFSPTHQGLVTAACSSKSAAKIRISPQKYPKISTRKSPQRNDFPLPPKRFCRHAFFARWSAYTHSTQNVSAAAAAAAGTRAAPQKRRVEWNQAAEDNGRESTEKASRWRLLRCVACDLIGKVFSSSVIKQYPCKKSHDAISQFRRTSPTNRTSLHNHPPSHHHIQPAPSNTDLPISGTILQIVDPLDPRTLRMASFYFRAKRYLKYVLMVLSLPQDLGAA